MYTLSQLTEKIQKELEKQGHSPGVIDGLYGYNTANALIDLLDIDLACQTPPKPTAPPPWLDLALNEIGITEVPGPNHHNQRILAYHSVTSLNARQDEVPWCSSFACWVMEQAGYISTRSAAARSWLGWGQKLEQPEIGCIAVFARGQNPRSGHVGFYTGQGSKPNTCQLVSGNMSNQVTQQDYSLRRFLGWRWPLEVTP